MTISPCCINATLPLGLLSSIVGACRLPHIYRNPGTTFSFRRHHVRSTLPRFVHADSFLPAYSANYMDEMYAAWQSNPESVHGSWQEYFRSIEEGLLDTSFLHPQQGLAFGTAPVRPSRTRTSKVPVNPLPDTSKKHANLQRMIRAYRELGHLKANTNPLQLPNRRPPPEELSSGFYGFTEDDLDREFELSPEVLPHFAPIKQSMTLREIIQTCESIYCGSMGAEYHHVATRQEREWIQERIESPAPYQFSAEEKKRILDRVVWATAFEKFMSAKFPNAKRFGLEGVENQLPALKAVIDACADDHGVRNIVFPCCHRGKLNVLSNVGRKPNELIFAEFSPESTSRYPIPGDVKYHMGLNHERETPAGNKVNISILPNPSHLESQNTLAQGMARALQQQNGGDTASTLVFNSHTDAAFSGQGVVYETLGLSGLKSYGTGGTIHLLINNQIGFTTDAESARTSPYVSDIAKSINAPVFHVNADDVEAVVFLCKLAAAYRAKFGKDCWIDMICYRRRGHNEMDQPAFTQPLMYEQIAKKTPQLELYANQLMREGVVTREEAQQMEQDVWNKLTESFENSTTPQPFEREYLTERWRDMISPEELVHEVLPAQPTAIPRDVVDTVARKLGIPDEPFTVHKSLRRVLQKRQQSLKEGREIDWATAEALAMGSLCLEGHHVRVSGQDVERGTFSQRHAVLHDQTTGTTYTPLDDLSPDQARFTIGNSSLSEYGVMGFDYGYSCMYPDALVMWEAQFGDFANNAQCIIDQFISSGESKWLLRSGLVLSLPHGFDGQGPEHSSARLERFLQLSSEDGRFFPSEEKLQRQHQDANMQIVCMTTPANLFHVLRRQLHRSYRKPLVIFFSKSLLRHPTAKSNIEDFTGESRFHPFIADPAVSNPSAIKRVIFCTGQVYMALTGYRDEHGITDTAIVRIEQLHPFPWEEARDNLNQYTNVEDVVWCQEESLNDGAWSFARTRLETIFDTTSQHKGRRLRFAGREATPSVATGFMKEHRAQEAALLKEAFQQC
ncbi:thiamine diphosphate-binding protein [Aspergillus ambiguus]|uniref:2-oxoglutarate dehydrogenase family protein n=1 Tax=Aspergillus ambiguus TaxID=176160 RepID=UPI003CCD36CB